MNLNPIDFNYQDGLNRFPIQDYIDENISVSDNNSSNYSSNLTAILRNDVKKLIGEETENITVPAPATLKHTYIYNSNLAGEIRFWSYGWFSSPNNLTIYPDWLVKIDVDGRLKVYYIYDPLINLTLLSGWLDIGTTLAGLLATDINTAGVIIGIQAEIILLQNKVSFINDLNAQTLRDIGAFGDIESAASQANYNNYLSAANNLDRMTPTGYLGEWTSLYNQIRGYIRTRNQLFYTAATQNIAVIINDNPLVTFYLGLGGIGIGIAASIINNHAYLNEVARQLNSNITYSSNINDAAKNELHAENDKRRVLELAEYCSNISNLTLAQGYINSNITTAQTIPNINTNTITYNGVEISTTLNNYLLKAGGTMTGRINFNYGANVGVPVAGSGGSGERINLNINGLTINDYAASIGVSANSLWMSAPINHSYQWYNNGNEIMSLSSAGQLILNTTPERQYPPKLYNSTTNESVITYLGQSGILSGTITLNTTGITYGSGVYELYSSSRYDVTQYQKRDLFNYNVTTNEVGAHWLGAKYSSFVYNGTNYIKPDYLGEFLVVKFPVPIVLTRYRFYPRLTHIPRLPAEWKFYGSMNGVDFTEITQASQMTILTTNNYPFVAQGYYEKKITTDFNTPYLYIGFTVNKLVGGDTLNFQEFQIFGKELLSSTASLAIGTSDATTYALNVNGVANASLLKQQGQDITTISSNIVINQTPNVQKKFMFTGTCSSSMLMPDGITYFAYDIDLRNYTGLKYAPNPNTPYRIFKIKVFFGSVYFGYLTNTKPNVLSYEVYMSNESQAGGGGIGSAGLNVCALGYPENVILNAISPTQLSLVCGDFNFVTVLSRVNGSVFNAIIEDCLF
jgi:hypothetical protein